MTQARFTTVASGDQSPVLAVSGDIDLANVDEFESAMSKARNGSPALTVDLTDLPQASIGSPVECWGKQIDVNQVAQQAGTIAYELLCNVKRVPKVYQN